MGTLYTAILSTATSGTQTEVSYFFQEAECCISFYLNKFRNTQQYLGGGALKTLDSTFAGPRCTLACGVPVLNAREYIHMALG